MKTSNLGLNVPDFDTAPWHDLVNNNFQVIDGIIHTMFGITNVKGVYLNSTAVSAGERYIDATTGEMFEVVVDYVTDPVPTTFSADRTAHPSNWLLIDASAALNGLAQMLTIRTEVFDARDDVEDDRLAVNAALSGLHLAALDTIGGTPITITDYDNAKNFPNTVIYAASPASLLPSGFEYGVVGSPGRAGLGFYFSLDANNGYVSIIALASGNRWERRYEGGVWQAWSRPANRNEVVRRDYQLLGNAEGIVDNTATFGADIYKVAAGSSNLPTWASLGDIIVGFSSSNAEGSLLLVGRNGRIATKGKTGNVWGAWIEHLIPTEIARKGLTFGGNANTLMGGSNVIGGDFYRIVAGFSNLPSWAAVDDTLINMPSTATDGAQICLSQTGVGAIRGFNGGVWTAWTDIQNPVRFESAQIAYANDGSGSVAHGLGAVPRELDAYLICLTAQGSLAIGDRYRIPTAFISVRADATNVYYRVLNTGISIMAAGGTATALTAANFRLLLQASL